MEPTRLGRYIVEREIGRGAMGRVYLAHDPEIDRKVAVKTVLIPEAEGRRPASASCAKRAPSASCCTPGS